MRRRFAPIVLCLLLSTAYAHADVQISPDLANRAAADFRQILPSGFDVTIADPLTLRVGAPDKMHFQVNLDRINSVCLADPDHCDAVLADFVSGAVQAFKAQTAPASKEMLRAVVRPNDYVEELKHELRGQEPVAAPLVGDLSVLCYFDMPTAMRISTIADINALGLSVNDAIALCKRNMASVLPPLQSQIEGLPVQSLGIMPEDPYQSSRLIFHDDWAPIAAKLDGHLIVSIPATDTVIYGMERDAADVDAMSALAKKLFAQAQRPVSTKVFRWTPAGWDIAAP